MPRDRIATRYMEYQSADRTKQHAGPARALKTALGQSEEVKVLVEESAEELSVVNRALKDEIAEHEALPAIEVALEKSEGVETKVQVASEKLAVVNDALQSVVNQRNVLEDQLLYVTEQRDVDHHAAFHDPLTGLPNRALFDDRLRHGLAQAARYGRTLAVMFLDLNDFKVINDTHGHGVGDTVLQEIARRLTDVTRDADTVSRYGGDEFLYLFMETGDERHITMHAEEIIKALRAPCVVGSGDDRLSLSVDVAVGIALFPANGTTAEELTKSADEAMYRAKRSSDAYSFA